jgi:hypothetical protein
MAGWRAAFVDVTDFGAVRPRQREYDRVDILSPEMRRRD